MGENERREESVEITLKIIGPSRPSRLRLPSSIKVHDLRNLVAGDRQLPVEQLKLILRGEILHDSKNGDDVCLQLSDGDSMLVAVKPKPPPRHISDEFDDEDDDDLKFQLPQSTSRWKRRLFSFLHDKLRLPDVGSYPFMVYVGSVAYRWDLGPLYILGTGFTIILLNLGKRQHGDLSAYSIFNENFVELPGTLNAERIDRDIRAGQF